MKRVLRFFPAILMILAGGVGCAPRQAPAPEWPWMWNWVDGTPRRVASTDPTGANRDSIAVQPGDTATLADLEGAGVVRHIWMTTNASGPVGRSHVIRMYWDGAAEPAVEVPIGDFYGVGHGLQAEVYSFPITVASRGRAWNCWWPMPYADGARITVTNEGPEVNGALYFYIDYLETDRAPTEERFYAQYRQTYPADSPGDYVFLDTTGRGRFVGVLYNVESTEPQWWGEGDDRIAIDGNDPILGTGTEDYFSDAWGMREYAGIWHGAPVVEGYDAAGLRSSMYRFHILDPLPFKESFLFSIEHGHANDRADNLSSVAFWYQVPPASPFPELAPLIERISASERETMIRQQAWRLAVSQDPGGGEKLAGLGRAAQTPANKALTLGLLAYREAIRIPNETALEVIDRQLEELDRQLLAIPESERFKAPEIDLPTDDDNPVPNRIAAAKHVLERARHDLARRLALEHGLMPGDEIVLESRGPDGTLTLPPAYEETSDYTDSYAKVDDPRLMGHGARFTYGKSDPSWARFVPDLPKAGRYEVLVVFSYGANAGDTRYTIRHAEGTETVELAQRGRPGTPGRNNREWHSLGMYRFPAGRNAEEASVTLYSSPGIDVPNPDFEYRAYSDAVRFVFRGD